jgi:hypothetical protein
MFDIGVQGAAQLAMIRVGTLGGTMTTHRFAVLALTLSLAACATDEPAPHDDGGSEQIEPGLDADIDPGVAGQWCGVTVSSVDADAVPEGFEVTPNEAVQAVSGRFEGALDDGTPLLLDVAVTGQVSLVRAESFEADEEPEGVERFDGPCSDHLRLPLTASFDAGDALFVEVSAEAVYADAGDALDGSGSDTSLFAAIVDDWQGTVSPSWDVDTADVTELTVFGYWESDTWRVDLSFWGEGTSGDGPDATAWAGEEPVATGAELSPVD